MVKSENAPIKDYLPVFNEGAEKVRAVSVKESNHFNNLQSIAETFECWVDLDITRDAFGGIASKKVKLKNYAGNDNHACFRYGVNLKDIQRTYESKNITTKLIVKQNNNELGEDGFCTIQRAGANPTGESYIYDFQYY
jgi:phage minor structural protein